MNRLADETSPYLRQHRDNPVDWYPWGDEAFEAARSRNVPILLSIGYSACHWCHVMAHESFEDDTVAEVLNSKFVSIKVDREERPDVDDLYMEAVQALTGRGGWPMTVVLDHDGRPFWGGTYFRQPDLLKVLDQLDDVWHNRQEDLDKAASQLMKSLTSNSDITPGDEVPGIELVNATLKQISGAFDATDGGFGKAPKFPSTHHLEVVLRAFMTSGNAGAKQVITTTLDAMAAGGMYDHLGGGFARYSTDERWLVPHFEKMLYDQAMLVRIYRQGFSVIGDHAYRQVVAETIGYVLRDLRHPDGGFYSAEDADSPDADGKGVEGLFYTWTPDEVRAALAAPPDADGRDSAGHDVEAALDWYGITDDGNFDEPPNAKRSIPNRGDHRGALIRPPEIERARAALFKARERRARPGLDDKVLTEWNALFLTALADAAATMQRADWKAAAIANGEFLLDNLRDDRGRWYRSWHADGQPQARHRALAADYAALVEAFIRLAELTGEARWIAAATSTADTMLDDHWDPQLGGLFTTAENAEQLVVRKKDVHDGATPSANSVAALALQRLAALTGEMRYANHADRILQLLATVAKKSPGAVSNALIAIELRNRGLIELAIAGDRPDLVKVAQVLWRPDLVLAWGERFESPLWEGRTDDRAYFCRQYVCEEPISTPEALYEKIAGRPIPDGAVMKLPGAT